MAIEGPLRELGIHDVFQLLDLSRDRKSTRLNSSHVRISYAVFCLKKKKRQEPNTVAYSPAVHTGRSDIRMNCTSSPAIVPNPFLPGMVARTMCHRYRYMAVIDITA